MKETTKTHPNKATIFNIIQRIPSQITYLAHFILTFIILNLIGCSDHTWKAEINTVLSLAGSNRIELEKVLNHYSKDEPNKAKSQAARFLIANMRWHQSFVLTHKANTFLLDSLTKSADSLYYQYIKDILSSVTLSHQKMAKLNHQFRVKRIAFLSLQ